MVTQDQRPEDRVRKHTATVNARIDKKTTADLHRTSREGPHALKLRLWELDREWDVDRALMANFAILGALSHELGIRYHRGWTNVFRAQLGFLLMHAIVGWCPPLPVFHRLGFRTSREIAAERATIKERLDAHTFGGPL